MMPGLSTVKQMASGEPLPVFQVRELLVLVNLLGVTSDTRAARLARPASAPPLRLESSETTQAMRRQVLVTSSVLKLILSLLSASWMGWDTITSSLLRTSVKFQRLNLRVSAWEW